MYVRWLGILLIFFPLSFVVPLAGQPSRNQTDQTVFDLTTLHQFHLTISLKDYSTMDPPPRANPFAPLGGARGGGARPMPGSPDFGAGNFGYEFPYVQAGFQTGDQTFEKVGLRYKGSGTYMMSARQAKRSFKIDFDRHDAKQSFHGLAKLNLNSGVMDPTKVREALAYAVFRAAGVPAPRTAFAAVSLTVPGKYEKEYLGLYTVVEQVDEQFLKIHFKNEKGLLLKPEGIRGLPYFGENPAAYEETYTVKSKKGRGDMKRLVTLARLVNRAGVEEFRKDIGAVLDVDAFVRFLAANTFLASMDGFLGLGHNYYLYEVPETGRFVFVPWDLDLGFGAFGMYGTADQLTDLSIDHPHLGENKLIDRLLAMPDVKEAYRAQLRRLVSELLTEERLKRDLEAVEKATRDWIGKERIATAARKEGGGFGGPAGGGMFAGLPLRTFIDKRVASIVAQLDGKRTGYVPSMMFGQPPPPRP